LAFGFGFGAGFGLSCAWAASGAAVMTIVAATAARMAFLVSTTVLQQLSARQLCAPDQTHDP